MAKLHSVVNILIALSLASVPLAAQSSGSNPDLPVILKDTNSITVKKAKDNSNPQTATRLAIIPGAGQFYNRDFWKLPIVYLSLGGSIFAYHLNSLKYHDFLRAYKSFYNLNTGQLAPGISEDSKALVRVRYLFNTASRLDSATRDQIQKQKNYWRRYRNIAILTIGTIYAISIIEANVASHLKGFDISEDLTLHVAPKLSLPALGKVNLGIQLVFKLVKFRLINTSSLMQSVCSK